MKKFTLLLCLFVVSVMMPQWAMANFTKTVGGLTVTVEGTTLTISSLTAAGDLKSFVQDGNNSTEIGEMKACKSLVLSGKFNANDLDAIKKSSSDFAFTSVDMSQATFPKTISQNGTNYRLFNDINTIPNNQYGNSWDDNMRIYGGKLYKSTHSTTRNAEAKTMEEFKAVSNDDRMEKLDWSEREFNSNLNNDNNFVVNKYYKILNAVYYQKQPDWAEIQEVGGSIDVVEALPVSGENGEKKKVPLTYNYYKLKVETDNEGNVTSKSWENANESDGQFVFDSTPDANKNDRLDYHYDNNHEYVKFAATYKYYEWKLNQKWEPIAEENIPEGTNNISYYNENYSASAHLNESNNDIVGFRNSTTNYKFYYVTETTTYYWTPENYTDSTSQSIVCQAKYYERLLTPNADNKYAIVGGKEWKKTNEWSVVEPSDNDWSLVTFSYWDGALETAILPPGILASDLKTDGSGVWGGGNLNTLKKVQSGVTYAEIAPNNGNREATIHSTNSDELKRLTAIVCLNNLIEQPQDRVHEAGGQLGDFIECLAWYDGHDVYQVHVTNPGTLQNYFNKIKDRDGAVLWFDSSCNINEDDLLKLADVNPKYYVDLYDIQGGENTGIEEAVTKAIETMRTENKQFKALILPKDPATVGTSLIKDEENASPKKSTCSEFIAYRNKTTTAAYIYSEQNNNRGNYVNRLLMLKDMLEAPAHNDEIVSNTTIYSISSNCVYKIGNESSGTITSTVFDILGTNKTIIETIDNDMVSGGECSPKMYVLSQVYDDFSKADSVTSIARTPNVDLIQLNGKVSSKDIKAVNSFTNGTRVLDLKNADTNTCVYTNNNGTKKNMLDSLKTGDGTTISQLQYIILPADMDTMVVHSYPTNLPNLKAIISIGNTHLTAHLNEAGTLAEARKLDAESEHVESENLTKVTLRGKLNLNDISAGGEGNNDGLHGDANNIERMDLEKAVFYNASGNVDCNQMNFATAGFHGSQLKLKNVTLPTDMRMNTIPEDCFYETKSLDSICVTYNYEYIYDGAFNETGLSHITTTNGQKGIVIDNGPNTYTFSKNLKQLGTKPYKMEGETRVESLYKDDGEPRPVARSVFPKEAGVLEIYPLATKVPKCYKNVFEYSLTFGYGGQDQTKVYSRDRYFNNGDIKKSFSVLRYPSKDVYNRRVTTGQVREDSYGRMEYLYTDTLKVYTKKDQTGAVDANGDPILWPMRTEGNRTYNQACVGALWNDWTVSYSGENGAEINDGENGGVSVDTTHFNNSSSRRLVQRRGKNYPRTDLIEYLGWHQIVLTQATYLDAIEEYNEDKKFERNFVETMWFTFCIPFDMTYSQVVKMLGVPKSEGNVINNIVNSDGDVITANVSADVLPDIRQLKQVTRTSSNDPNTTPNTVNFILTENLISGKTAQYLNFPNDATVGFPTNADNSGADDPVCLLGGRPYIIKAYKRQGEIIPNQNLGLYLLKRYADDFKPSSSCVNRATADSLDYFEQLYEANNTQKKKTLKFAKPYEKHKVLAVQDNPESKKLQFKDEQGNWHNYYYTMIGQFWEQPLPLYCLYMVNGGWQHYQVDRGFKWAPYKCVLMATPEKTTRLTENGNTTGDGGFRIDSTTVYNGKIYNGKKLSVYPQATKGDLLPADKDFRLGFVGRNDYDFESAQNNARYIFTMDDDIIELDEDGNQMTAIDMLDGDVQLSAVRSKKVYCISGKYMGTTTKGLPKGIYIVGGRKIVID